MIQILGKGEFKPIKYSPFHTDSLVPKEIIEQIRKLPHVIGINQIEI